MKKFKKTKKQRKDAYYFVLLVGLLLLSSFQTPFAVTSPSSQELYAMGLKFLKEKKYYDGAMALEKAVTKNPTLIRAHIELAKTLTLLDRRKEALYKLNLAKKYAPNKKLKKEIQKNILLLSETFYTGKSFQLYQNGLNHMKTNKLQLAIQSFEKALKKEPHNVAILLPYGDALQKNGELQKSVAFLERAFSMNPNKKAIRVRLAKALVDTNPERAAYSLKPLLSEKQLEEDIYILYARTLSLLDRKEEAIRVLKKGLAKKNEGMLLYWMGKYYTELSKNDWMARRYLTLFLRQKGNFSENEETLREYRNSAKKILSKINKKLEISPTEKSI